MGGRSLIVALIALGVVLAGAVVIGVVTSGGPPGVASLEELQEQEVLFLDEHEIYLVYNDGDPLALSADAQHVGDDVEFCPSSQMFESSAHGEKFDIHGYYYGGPARRGLDRYPVRMEGGGIYVDVDQPIQGPERGEGPPIEPQGRLCNP